MLSILNIIWDWFDLSVEFSKSFWYPDSLLYFYFFNLFLYNFPFFRIFYLFLLLDYSCFLYSNLFVFTVPGLNCTFQIYISLFLAIFFYLFLSAYKRFYGFFSADVYLIHLPVLGKISIFLCLSFNILSSFYGFGLPRNTFVSRFYLFRSIRRWKIHSMTSLNLAFMPLLGCANFKFYFCSFFSLNYLFYLFSVY